VPLIARAFLAFQKDCMPSIQLSNCRRLPSTVDWAASRFQTPLSAPCFWHALCGLPAPSIYVHLDMRATLKTQSCVTHVAGSKRVDCRCGSAGHGLAVAQAHLLCRSWPEWPSRGPGQLEAGAFHCPTSSALCCKAGPRVRHWLWGPAVSAAPLCKYLHAQI